MPEYRGSLTGESVLPAKDYAVATGQGLKKGDLVTLNASGELVKATSSSTNLLGVSEGKAIQTEYEESVNKLFHKVRPSNQQIIELEVTGGTPVIGQAYGITNDHKLDVGGTGSLVKVIRLVNDKAWVTIAASAGV